jgi:RHS repeat-associated protein
MFKYFIATLFAVFCCCSLTAQITPPIPYPQDTKISYIRTWVATAPEQDQGWLTIRPLRNVKQTTQYIDGIGRPLQIVTKQGSLQSNPNANAIDLVSSVEYDQYGREVYKYLPFVANATGGNTSLNDGLFKFNPFQQQANFAATQYPGETFYYGQAVYEPSPLNRVTETFAAGNSWAGTSANTNANDRRSLKQQYWVNTAVDEVRIWQVDNVQNGFGTYSTAQVYPAGRLYKNVSADEMGNEVIEFKDSDGQLILKKVQHTAVADDGTGRNHTDWLCTYYIYDDLNNLRCVVQPKGVELLAGNNWDMNASSDILNEQCFRYEYDQRSRMIMKKIPGAGEVYMVYDARNRLVMTQDANLRASNSWMVMLYENKLNRPIQTGKLLNTYSNKSFQQHRADAGASDAYPFDPLATPSAPYWEYLTKTGYDDYSTIPAASGLTGALDNSYSNHFYSTYNNSPEFAQPITAASQTMGMVTWTETKVLGTSTYLYTVTIYDEKGRVIQVKSKNTTNGSDIITTQYSWSGQPLILVQKLENGTASQTSIIVNKMTYDDLGRLTRIEKKIGNSLINNGVLPADFSTIVENEYDALGQLKYKHIGKKRDASGNYTVDPLETLTYDYNIRGWMLGMNREYLAGTDDVPHFGFELGYDKLTNVVSRNFVKPAYNGNINGMVWKSVGDGIQRKYDFDYDAASRLLKADFEQHNADNSWGNGQANFRVLMGDGSDPKSAYDANGNIKRMQQWGLKVSGSAQIDDLRYTYYPNSNRLRNVVDFHNDEQTKLADFRTSANHPQKTDKSSYIAGQGSVDINSITDYTYDDNGNLKKDLNKDIGNAAEEGIIYNHLNLPEVITVRTSAGTVKGTITYTYDATGNKLKKATVDQSTGGKVITTTTTYLGGIVYESKTTVPANTPNDDYANKLQFIGHEEGRIRYIAADETTPAKFEYDYFVKDHLGNVRMVLTEERKQDPYPAATLEGGDPISNTDAVYEEKKHYNINDAYVVDITKNPIPGLPVYQNNNGNPPYNYNKNSNTTANSNKLYKLNAATNKTGLGITLKVMAGDDIYIFGKSYWFNSGGNYNEKFPIPINGILDAFLTAPAMAAKGLTTAGITTTGLTDALDAFRSRTDNVDVPWAYINWIFFDEQFNYAGGGFDRVDGNGVLKNHALANRPDLTAPKSGYVFVYCSNESQEDVFFDNLQVFHNRGPLLEETHYYPFGLTMSGISSKAIGPIDNKYKFNEGSELESKEFSDGSGLDLYATEFRNYDPQTGRFLLIDPLAEFNEFWTPYNYCNNNPIIFNDPLGLDTVGVVGKVSQLPATLGQEVKLINTNGGTSSYIYDPNNPNADMNGLVENGMTDQTEEAVIVTAKKSQKSKPASTNAPARSKGANEGDIAATYPGRDMRPYFMGEKPNTVDCSRFAMEVAAAAGYSIPRGTAIAQAKWYKKNGQWSDNLKEVQKGDHIFWLRDGGYHTGVVSESTLAGNQRVIKAVQAQTFNHKPGSIQEQKLLSNGEIQGFHQKFVGVGRYP